MANYYVDGSIVSASGSGSGTIGDPWGKTDDLIQYSLVQIAAGAGAGAKGDTVIVLAGELTNTAPLDPTVWSAGSGSGNTALTFRAVNPEVLINWEMGATKMIVYPYQGVHWFGFRFYNYKEVGTDYPFKIFRYHTFSNCIFDGYAEPHYGLISGNVSCAIIGCAVVNDNRYQAGGTSHRGYQVNMSNGIVYGNYFESTSTAGTAYYSHGTGSAHVEGNIYYDTCSYSNGFYVPTQGARFSRNTFYNGSTAAPCIFAPSNYTNSFLIANNYFEGWSDAIKSNSYGRLTIGRVCGNKGFNNSALVGASLIENDNSVYDFHDGYWKNDSLAESALIDPANKDFRPKSALVGAGFDSMALNYPNVGGGVRPNVGAVEGYKPDSFIGQYNPFGGN